MTKAKTKTTARRPSTKAKGGTAPPATWKTSAVRVRCLEAATAATMPTFRVDDAMKSDEEMIQFAEDSGESLDWLVRGLENHRRRKPAPTPPITKKAEDRRIKALAKGPDGKKAFHAISDQENALTTLDRFTSALFIIAGDLGDDETRSSDALYGIANAMEDALKEAWEKRRVAWDATWAFEFGDGGAVQ